MAILGVQLAHHLLVTLREAGTKTIEDKQIPLLDTYMKNLQNAQTSLQPYLGKPPLIAATPPRAGCPRTTRAGVTR